MTTDWIPGVRQSLQWYERGRFLGMAQVDTDWNPVYQELWLRIFGIVLVIDLIKD